MAIVTGLACLAAGALAAEDREYVLKWNDLPPMVAGRKLTATLRDGTRVKGKALAVEPEGLRMRVAGSETTVPRAAVARLKVSRGTWRWRVIGTAIGVGAGAPAAGFLHARLYNEGTSSPAVALVVVVPAALGYLAGWAADRHTTLIRIAPGD